MRTTERPIRAGGNDDASLLLNAQRSDIGRSTEIVRQKYPGLTEKDVEEARLNLKRYFEIAFAITAQLDMRDSNLTHSKAISRMNERSNDQNRS